MFHMRKFIYLILISVLLFSLTSHGVVGEEDKVLYQKDVDRMLEEGNYNFSGCIFKENINFSGITLIDADFSNAVFEEEVNFNDLNCTDVNFSNATFEKNVYFNNITFNTTGDNYTSFIGAHFKGEVKFMGVSSKKGSIKFDNAVFEGDNNNFYNINAKGDVHFNNVIFKKSVGFHEFEFKQGIDFKGSIFENNFRFGQKGDTSITKGIASFQNVTFGGNTIFDNVSFKDSVQFNSADPEKDSKSERTVFKGYAYFEDVTFNGSADFNDVTFEGEVIFSDVTFKGDTFFKKGSQKKGTIFKGETSFSGVNFEESVYFNDAIFGDTVWFYSHGNDKKTTFGKENYPNERKCTASFIRTEFQGQTNFNDCVFNVEADFSEAKFKDDTEFMVDKFKKHATFPKAIFGDDADFVGIKFESETYFSKAKFNGDASFFMCYFNSGVNFDSSRFRGDLELKTVRLSKNLSLSNVRVEKALILEIKEKDAKFINLRNLKVYGYGIVTANLKRTSFEGAFLKNINFIDCTWPENYIVYEENNKELKCTDLEFIYRNLKNSFQNYGDNEMASHFFYREMEMKRKGTSLIKDPIKCGLLHILYGVCGYGEKLSWLLIWSFIVIFGFAGSFWVLGIEVNIYPHKLENNLYRFFSWEIDNRDRMCRCRIFSPICSFFSFIKSYTVGIRGILGNFAFCLLFSISSFSTLGSNYIKPKSNASRWLSAFESLIGAFFIALFIYVFARKMLR